MASGLDRSKRLAIRATLVTSSTVATILGAQSLALIDLQRQAADPTEVSEPATAAPLNSNTPIFEATLQPRTPAAAAPFIVILRGSTKATAPQTSAQPPAIQPPAPVEIVPPAPVIVQQAAPQVSALQIFQVPLPRTRSSR
jgi:hypothetical protein